MRGELHLPLQTRQMTQGSLRRSAVIWGDGGRLGPFLIH